MQKYWAERGSNCSDLDAVSEPTSQVLFLSGVTQGKLSYRTSPSCSLAVRLWGSVGPTGLSCSSVLPTPAPHTAYWPSLHVWSVDLCFCKKHLKIRHKTEGTQLSLQCGSTSVQQLGAIYLVCQIKLEKNNQTVSCVKLEIIFPFI